MAWTITHDTTTQSCAAWGMSNLVRSRRNQEADTLIFRIDGHGITTAPPFAVDDILTFKKDTVVWFVGRCLRPRKSGNGANESLTYEVQNVWGELQRRAYLQSAKQYAGLVDDVETFNTFYTSHCIIYASANLDYDANADGKSTLGEVLAEILDYAIAGGAPVQYDQDELDALTIVGPSMPMTDPRCADAIREALRFCPDCVVWFDYTSTPATIHFVPRASMSALTVAIGDAGDGVTACQLAQRDDLAVPFCYIKYEQTNSEDGKTWLSIAPQMTGYAGDLYPTSAHPDGLTAMDGLVLTIDLQGSTTSTVRGQIRSAALPSGTSPSADWKTWLIGRVPWLSRSEITTVTMDSLTIVTGGPDMLAYELLPGSGGVAEWMRTSGGAAAAVVEATIKFRLTLEYAGDITLTKDIDVRISTTNLPSATYSLREITDAGEPVPTGLAQYLYTQMSAGHWEGQVTYEQEECPGTARPGKLLSVTGGDTDWATMGAVVFETVEDIDAGATTISVGPNKWLSAGEIMGWLKAQRGRNNGSRRAWNTLSTGIAAGGLGDVSLTNSSAVDAPTGGVPDFEDFSIRKLNTGANTVDTAKGQILLSRAHACDSGNANGKLVQVRQLKCNVKNLAGTAKTRLLVVASDAYDTSIHASELELAASGGSVKAYKVQAGGAGFDDYVTVKEWSGGAETGDALNIAKPPYLRIAAKPTGGTFVISPTYVGAVIYGVAVDGGTDVSGATIIDLNVDARKWAAEVKFCEEGVAKKSNVDMGTISNV